MKIKVLKRFHDKVNDKVYEIGDIVEVTNERGNEIISHPLGLAEKVGGAEIGVDLTPDFEKSEVEIDTNEKPKAQRKRK